MPEEIKNLVEALKNSRKFSGQLTEERGITENLKGKSQMEWVQ